MSTLTADAYARWRASRLGRITEALETDVIVGLAGPIGGRRVLDVGTGDGSYAIEAARRGAHVCAIDPADDMLAAARRRATAADVAIDVRPGRVEQLPFADGSFDVVIAVTVLCLVPSADAAVREMKRVLAPAGRLVVGELGRFSAWSAQRRIRGWLGSATWNGATFWTLGSLGALVERSGLDIDATSRAIYYPPSGVAAALLAPLDRLLGRLHVPGAAFLAIAART